MTKKIAVLYFGQARMAEGYDFALASHKRYLDGYEYDTYMHLWLFDSTKPWIDHVCLTRLNKFVAENYKPIKSKIELSRSFHEDQWVSADIIRRYIYSEVHPLESSISQIYSINQVCNLVENPGQYDKFILIRTDTILDDWKLPKLESLDTSSNMYTTQDWINIFGQQCLKLYGKLLDHNKTSSPVGVVDGEKLRFSIIDQANIPRINLDFCASIVRIAPNDKIFVVYSGSEKTYVSYLTSFGVLFRRLDNNFVCRFPPKSTPRLNQWIGKNLPMRRKFAVSYSLRFLVPPKSYPCRWKSYNPDTVSEDWFKNPTEWHHIVSDTLTPMNSPFLFVFFDDVLNNEEIIIEIADVILIPK